MLRIICASSWFFFTRLSIDFACAVVLTGLLNKPYINETNRTAENRGGIWSVQVFWSVPPFRFINSSNFIFGPLEPAGESTAVFLNIRNFYQSTRRNALKKLESSQQPRFKNLHRRKILKLSGKGLEIFLFSETSRPALRLTRVSVRSSSRGLKLTIHCLAPKIRISGAIPLLLLYAWFHGVDRHNVISLHTFDLHFFGHFNNDDSFEGMQFAISLGAKHRGAGKGI